MTRLFAFIAAVGLLVVAAGGASPVPWQAYQGPDVGGRELALSGSVAAISDDAALAFWNPAGIAFMKWQMAIAGYTHSVGVLADPLFSGPKRLNYLALAGPQGGFSWRSLAQFKGETVAGRGPDTAYHYLKYSIDEFGLAFASKDQRYPNFSLGIAAKLIWSRLTEQTQAQTGSSFGKASLQDENGVGYGLDAGLLWDGKPVRLFVNFQNLLAKVYYSGYTDDKPKIRCSGGIGWHTDPFPSISVCAEKCLFAGSPRLKYLISGEYKKSIENYGALTGRAGYAAYYHGATNNYSWTWGLGYIYAKFMIDAAAINQREPGSQEWKTSYAASVSMFLN